MSVLYLILLIFTILIFGLCCVVIIKRKNYTSIAIRSPTLLLFNILGCFFSSLIIIIYKMADGENKDSIKYLTGFYYLFHFLMIMSFFLRLHRIIKCCQINPDEKISVKQKYSSRKFVQEKYLFKILLIWLGIFLIVLIIVGLIFKNPFTFIFIDNDYNKYGKAKLIIWIILNFLEQIILMTYAYNIFVHIVKQKLRFELMAYIIILIIYSNIVTFADYKRLNEEENKYNELAIILTIIANFLFLLLNAIIPIGLSYTYRTSTGYYLTPQLLNNLYLFLSNESCFNSFKNYLKIKKNANGLLFLNIYTDIMNYKLGFILKVESNEGFREAREIFNKYFSPIKYEGQIDGNILANIRKSCQSLEQNVFTSELFDEGLKYVFNELKKIFVNYKRSMEYTELKNDVYLNSSIECKMYTMGLANKF